MCHKIFDWCIRNGLKFLENVITDDESWVFDPETKRQSSEWYTSALFRPQNVTNQKSEI